MPRGMPYVDRYYYYYYYYYHYYYYYYYYWVYSLFVNWSLTSEIKEYIASRGPIRYISSISDG